MPLKLTRNKLFIGIAIFALIVNLLVLFDLQLFYIRAILAFLFIVSVPGLLIMLMLKIRKIGFWEYLVYTIGLSVAFIMFAGLAVNWILPFLGITDKPLSLYPIVICFDIILAVFWIVAYKRNSKLKLEINSPEFSWLDRIFMIIPMLFPVMAVLGAFILNNHGPNYFTMIMLGAIAVYVFCIVLFRKRLNEHVFPWAIWMIGLSSLLMFSMRSWSIAGWDIFQEQLVFDLANSKGSWSMTNLRDAYNSCLSITILPTILDSFVWIKPQYIFKVFFQIIFSTIGICIFTISKRYFNNTISFLIFLAFFVPEGFLKLSVLARQHMSILFFALAVLVLFSKDIPKQTKTTLFMIFSFSMIVSHYSTTYISLTVLLLTYITHRILTQFKKGTKNSRRVKSFSKQKVNLTSLTLVIILLFAFLWNSQLTGTSSNLINILEDSVDNFRKILNEELKEEGSSLQDQFNIFYRQEDYTQILNNYTAQMTKRYNEEYNASIYPPSNHGTYIAQIAPTEILPFKISLRIISKINLFERILKILIKIFLIIGSFHLTYTYFKKRKVESEYIILSLAFAIIVILILLAPLLSVNYSVGRLYQHSLIILSIALIDGGRLCLRFLKRGFRLWIILILLLIFFLFSSGFVSQLIGGSPAQLHLNNLGGEYNQAYSHETEVQSAQWLVRNYDEQEWIYADRYARKRLYAFGDHWIVRGDVLPSTVDRRSYVYSNHANTIEKKASSNYKGRYLHFNFPSEFLDQNKNKIYTNGGSEVFK